MRRIFIILVVTTAAALAHFALGQESADNQGVLPIEQFTKYDEFNSPKLSPDGNYVAYLTGKYGHATLGVLSTKDKKLVGGVRAPERYEIYDFDWKSNSRIVYQIAERQPGMARPTPTGELEAINIDGKEQKFIYGYRAGEMQTGTNIKVQQEESNATAEIISPLLSDEKNILIAEFPWLEGASVWLTNRDAKPRLVRLDVFTGKKFTMEQVPLAGASILVDANDQPRFAFGKDDESRWAVRWKPDPNGSWQDFVLPGFKDGSVTPKLISEDNQTVFMTAVRNDESTSALYKVNLNSHEVTKVYGTEGADISSLITDLSGRRIVGVVTDIDKPQAHWIDETDRAAKIYRALIKGFPGQIISIVSKSIDGLHVIVLVHSDTNPGDYYLFDTQSMKADYFFSSSKWIAPDKMHGKEPFAFKARDGLELHGYITRPGKVGAYPMVVLPHGGPHNGRDEWDYDWEVQLLANRGYAVLQVNFRGSSGFGMDFESSGYREWGAKMQDDITDATHWAIDNKLAEQDRICIFGASYGGYAALMGAVREPKLYRCAIGYAGVYDLELRKIFGEAPRSRIGRASLSTMLGDDVAQLHSRSPAFNAAQIQIPVLLIHGKEDKNADFMQAKKMKAALEANHKEFEWMALSREGHGVYDEETRREVYERIIKFLDSNLKSDGSKTEEPVSRAK